jgi:hypothetical protein
MMYTRLLHFSKYCCMYYKPVRSIVPDVAGCLVDAAPQVALVFGLVPLMTVKTATPLACSNNRAGICTPSKLPKFGRTLVAALL